jgi:hypothetical protein
VVETVTSASVIASIRTPLRLNCVDLRCSF